MAVYAQFINRNFLAWLMLHNMKGKEELNAISRLCCFSHTECGKCFLFQLTVNHWVKATSGFVLSDLHMLNINDQNSLKRSVHTSNDEGVNLDWEVFSRAFMKNWACKKKKLTLCNCVIWDSVLLHCLVYQTRMLYSAHVVERAEIIFTQHSSPLLTNTTAASHVVSVHGASRTPHVSILFILLPRSLGC